MFDELKKYQNNGHFIFTKDDNLTDVCNAPKNKSGIYIVYELKNGKIELVYIGSSGKVQNDGKIKHRNGGLFDRIVNGHQFGDIPRKKSWPQKLEEENIEALDVYWYDTFNNKAADIPLYVEAKLIQKFFELYGHLPRWNKEF
ncbi:MAG: hypothetical protein AB7W47_12890 [Calditrichaceae bacterium]